VPMLCRRSRRAGELSKAKEAAFRHEGVCWKESVDLPFFLKQRVEKPRVGLLSQLNVPGMRSRLPKAAARTAGSGGQNCDTRPFRVVSS